MSKQSQGTEGANYRPGKRERSPHKTAKSRFEDAIAEPHLVMWPDRLTRLRQMWHSLLPNH